MIKKIIKYLLPFFFINILKKILISLKLLKYKRMSNKKIFEEIYNKKLWTPKEVKKNFKFYSGPGSHLDDFTKMYVKNIKEFLLSFDKKPNVVDLGCGDFQIGKQLRKYCDKYIAVDIFDELIDSNRKLYDDYEVEFKVLDITKNTLPDGKICFVRQVLQHLSNKNIKKFLNLAHSKYKYLILTEHLPNIEKFAPNLDIVTGPQIRLYKNSGVVLTEKPFNLMPISQKNICSISSKQILGFKGILKTLIYQLK
jgi:hypothetical protein